MGLDGFRNACDDTNCYRESKRGAVHCTKVIMPVRRAAYARPRASQNSHRQLYRAYMNPIFAFHFGSVQIFSVINQIETEDSRQSR